MPDSREQYGGACFSRPREKRPTRPVGAAASVRLSEVPDNKWEEKVSTLLGKYPGESPFNVYKALEHHNGDIDQASALLDLPETERGGKITIDRAERRCSLIKEEYISLIDGVIYKCGVHSRQVEEDVWCHTVKWYGRQLKYGFKKGQHHADYQEDLAGYKHKMELSASQLIDKLEKHYGTSIAESLEKHAKINEIREDAKKKAQDYIDRATQRAERQSTVVGSGSRVGGRNVRDGGGKRHRRKSKKKKRHHKTRKRKSKRRKYTKKR